MRCPSCLLVACVVASACSTGAKHEDGPAMPTPAPPAAPAPPVATPKVVLATAHGDATVSVEVVSTPAKVERGLMFREHLPPDDGMLFLMGGEQDWAFWMHNTLIPLDMIFITKNFTVAGVVANAVPRSDTLLRTGVPSVYVLEVNGGWAAAHQITAGAKVRFDGVSL